jgi:hypothetical protein
MLLLLLLLLLPPDKRRPTTQTACHINRSTETSPPLVQGFPMRAEIPRSSADVSESCKNFIFFNFVFSITTSLVNDFYYIFAYFFYQIYISKIPKF